MEKAQKSGPRPIVTLAVDASMSKKLDCNHGGGGPPKGCFNKQNLLSNFKPNLARMLQFSKFGKNHEKVGSDKSDSDSGKPLIL